MTDPTLADREVLPIPDRPYDGPVFEDAKDPAAKFPPIEPPRPPAGAPNVLIMLLDDAGFGSASAFGGPRDTPTAERLAREGLKFNRFHTTALCSPTRAALLSGRNHHTVGMSGVTELATSAAGPWRGTGCLVARMLLVYSGRLVSADLGAGLSAGWGAPMTSGSCR